MARSLIKSSPLKSRRTLILAGVAGLATGGVSLGAAQLAGRTQSASTSEAQGLEPQPGATAAEGDEHVGEAGAGAEARKVMGMTVFSGMLAATVIGVLVVPAMFVFVERFVSRREAARAAVP